MSKLEIKTEQYTEEEVKQLMKIVDMFSIMSRECKDKYVIFGQGMTAFSHKMEA